MDPSRRNDDEVPHQPRHGGVRAGPDDGEDRADPLQQPADGVPRGRQHARVHPRQPGPGPPGQPGEAVPERGEDMPVGPHHRHHEQHMPQPPQRLAHRDDDIPPQPDQRPQQQRLRQPRQGPPERPEHRVPEEPPRHDERVPRHPHRQDQYQHHDPHRQPDRDDETPFGRPGRRLRGRRNGRLRGRSGGRLVQVHIDVDATTAPVDALLRVRRKAARGTASLRRRPNRRRRHAQLTGHRRAPSRQGNLRVLPRVRQRGSGGGKR